ncbi:MAG TPA: class I SAM-dependent methyltransferase [Ilumatobacteraceae bacterium]|nr:class I SAM-dependent methyltransferase [Ilumatobacteraceae bacterium]
MVAVPHQQGALAEGVADEDVEIFNVAALWRYEAIVRLGLDGDSMVAAASPGAVFPQILDFLVRNVDAAPPGAIIDVGAGLAGIAETVRQASGRCVLAFDASRHACDGARRLFPEVQLARAHPSGLPVRDGSVAAVLACGLLSVLTDPKAMMSEARRVIQEQGCFVVVDLASASSRPASVGGKVFPSAERILGSLADAGFALADQAIGVTSLSDWALADAAIARDIADRRRGEAAFDHWLDDRRRFERMMSSDRVIMIGVAVRPC